MARVVNVMTGICLFVVIIMMGTLACAPTVEVVEVEPVAPEPAYAEWDIVLVSNNPRGIKVFALHPPPDTYGSDCIYYVASVADSLELLDKICKGEWNERGD